MHKIIIAIKNRSIAICRKHKKKILNLRHKLISNISYTPKEVVHIFSSYILSQEEHDALSHGLEHHIPSKVTRNSVNTEFESFYQSLLRDISIIPEERIARIKTQLRSKCEKYYNVKIPSRYRQAIKRLSNNKDIAILKQDKGRGVIILNRSKYIEKCLSIVNSSQFLQVDKDPTASIERKVQRTLRKIKDKIPALLYSKVYPTRSSPGRFHGTAKLHKVKDNGTVEDLPLRPIISTIRIATYELAKYLAQILKPLGQSQYTIKSSKLFIKTRKKQKISPGYQMVSFDVVSLFTNDPLEETINIIIKRIYDKNEINTNIPKQDMKELLYLCTKNAHFISC